ncbi:universal stress protein [Psychrosphaera sp. B3R10]|uniref:Universal stress protein n=1 Tax=Psychrosphaera algicola TaxID=3023714 RepID=A0ABT5FBM4_9GAMM|nr:MULTISPECIES: universal stress protein [unclassified Psychrosphaera]MBU2881895.1 universal stress protein [Psychrosphaera sp. I2R16]MBU2987886.1 universal stress protein [Psychrosphaera sp. B3R10]MDC2887992.1 universal stress protein [Psychrosphaera sp. G1-22]MDO6721503.1 universal stress protein [Psychrosphaera sp. 1_MG-2023]
MYKTIVCAIEASDEGENVLAKAHQFAQLCNAKLYVTNVISYSLLPKDYQKEFKEKTLPTINAMTDKLGISQKNVSVKFGKPYEQICTLAEKKNADLIILGTHSKKGLHALIGSTANGVANYAKCDVSLIKI